MHDSNGQSAINPVGARFIAPNATAPEPPTLSQPYSKTQNPKSKIAGVLFDLDGTLVDTVDLIVAGFQHATMAHLGYCIEPAAVKATIGRPLRECLTELAPELGDTLYDAYQDFNRQHHDTMIKEVPGVVAVLEELKRRGIAIGIVTSKRLVSAQRSLDRFDLAGHFDVLITQDDTTRHKPDPAPLLCGLQRLNLPASEVIYVGDAIHDIMAARAVPMRVAAVTWGAEERHILANLQPDWLIDDIAQLLEISNLQSAILNLQSRGESMGIIIQQTAAGGLVMRVNEFGYQTLLVRVRADQTDDWSLPKGSIEEGESRQQAAQRIVREQTGIDASIVASLGPIDYTYTIFLPNEEQDSEGATIRRDPSIQQAIQSYHRVVYFYLMAASGGTLGDGDGSVAEVQWFTVPEAQELLSHEGDLTTLARAVDLLTRDSKQGQIMIGSGIISSPQGNVNPEEATAATVRL